MQYVQSLVSKSERQNVIVVYIACKETSFSYKLIPRSNIYRKKNSKKVVMLVEVLEVWWSIGACD